MSQRRYQKWDQGKKTGEQARQERERKHRKKKDKNQTQSSAWNRQGLTVYYTEIILNACDNGKNIASCYLSPSEAAVWESHCKEMVTSGVWGIKTSLDK